MPSGLGFPSRSTRIFSPYTSVNRPYVGDTIASLLVLMAGLPDCSAKLAAGLSGNNGPLSRLLLPPGNAANSNVESIV